ncbi:MAG: hypothetical protein ACI9YE_000470 [Psychroserpens sp.]|jgi:hypothetical protein
MMTTTDSETLSERLIKALNDLCKKYKNNYITTLKDLEEYKWKYEMCREENNRLGDVLSKQFNTINKYKQQNQEDLYELESVNSDCRDKQYDLEEEIKKYTIDFGILEQKNNELLLMVQKEKEERDLRETDINFTVSPRLIVESPRVIPIPYTRPAYKKRLTCANPAKRCMCKNKRKHTQCLNVGKHKIQSMPNEPPKWCCGNHFKNSITSDIWKEPVEEEYNVELLPDSSDDDITI